MNDPILVDAGPLCAVFNDRDEHHETCRATLEALSGPLLTTWPVITEAAWLLRRNHAALQILLGLIRKGDLQIVEITAVAAEWLAIFMNRYADLPAQLADASLVYVGERDGIDKVFTLDRRDFSVYRMRGNQAFIVIPAS